jgi:hypothetical protein
MAAPMAFGSSQIALVAPVPVHEHVRDIGDNRGQREPALWFSRLPMLRLHPPTLAPPLV